MKAFDFGKHVVHRLALAFGATEIILDAHLPRRAGLTRVGGWR